MRNDRKDDSSRSRERQPSHIAGLASEDARRGNYNLFANVDVFNDPSKWVALSQIVTKFPNMATPEKISAQNDLILSITEGKTTFVKELPGVLANPENFTTTFIQDFTRRAIAESQRGPGAVAKDPAMKSWAALRGTNEVNAADTLLQQTILNSVEGATVQIPTGNGFRVETTTKGLVALQE